jgi:hypothetical protein
MRTISLSVILVGLSTAATAQETVPQLDAVLQCREQGERDARLACFDRTIAALDRARAAKTVLVLDRSAVVARKQRNFGLGSPPGDAFGGGEADRVTAVVDLETTIQRATPVAASPGRWTLSLANGMAWQTLEDLSRPPAAGTAIKLRRSSLGGFRATVGKQARSVLVKRLR